MSSLRVRVMVGEGRSARKGLLRFVLENEGYDVVAEAGSTLELAQKLVAHRPDVVVLDEAIDASAVGMIREVLPNAKIVLVWPRGVAAVGADARLEPAEVLSFLGPTVGRVVGRGPVLSPPRPRKTEPEVVVVPEAPPGAEPSAGSPFAAEREGRPAPEDVGAMASETTGVAVAAPPATEEPVVEVPEALSDVVMAPADLQAPRWTYTAAGSTSSRAHRRRWIWVAVAAVAVLAAFAAGLVANMDRTVEVLGVTGTVGSLAPPPPTGTGGGTSDQPGTYRGALRVKAYGTIRLSATGDLRLRITGLTRIVATGDVRVHGDGVVKSVTSAGVRVHGDGTVMIVMKDGQMHLRLQGRLAGRGVGVMRISGRGRFLIHHHPL